MRQPLLWIYALSGAAALLYQVVWQRWLVFTVGLSSVSIGVIVSGFLSGLGVGYLIGGGIADRLTPKQALVTFAALEFGIAVAALASHTVLYTWLPGLEGLGPAAPLRTYLAVLLLLLLPTMGMGASLPVLSRAVTWPTLLEQSGFISRLYFANTFGGAIAAVATAFVLVPAWGFDGAVRIGAVLNLLCAIGALWLGRGLFTRDTSTAPHDRDAPSWNTIVPHDRVAPSSDRVAPSLWLLHAFASGLTGIAWEVLAFRLVENIVKSRAQTFAVILGVFLTGLAFGGLLGDRVRDRLGPRRLTVFLATQTSLYLWLGGSVAVLTYGLERWSVARPWLQSIAAYEPATTPSVLLLNYGLLPLILLLVPALFMGFGFSLAQQLLQTSFSVVGRRLGHFQFANIAGCVTGAMLTTEVLIPTIGTSGAVKVVCLIGLAYAAAWLGVPGRRAAVPAVLGACIALGAWAVPSQTHLWRVLSGHTSDNRVLFREDASGVSSIRFTASASGQAEVFANGLGQSVLPRSLDAHHVLLGALPTFVHPAPARVGIIGVGSGGTLWGASSRPETTHVVAWEIMASQPALLAEYASRTGDPSVAWFLRDPRIDIRVADGRHALRASDERFDVIEADALRPSSSYAGNLYSIEFFRLVRSRLAPGGIAATWVPTPRVLNTVRQVFPHVVYLGNLVALCSDTPITVDWDAIRARLRHPTVVAHFEQGRMDAESLLAPVIQAGPAPLPAPTSSGAADVNTDMRPKDELGRGR